MMGKTSFLFVIVLLQMFQELESLVFIRCKRHEQEALLEFKQSFTKDPMNRLSSWVGEDCCQWHGVTCHNVTNNVVKLNLGIVPYYFHESEICLPHPHFSMVSSGVSSALLQLEFLTHLDLSGNNFSGSRIPEFLGSLRRLRYLNLSSSAFSGPLPYQLVNLKNLVHLDLHVDHKCYERSLLYSEDLGWATGLFKLQSLDLSSYNLSRAHDTLKVLNTLPALSALSLSDCALHNSHISEAFTANTSNTFFPNLQHLDLGWNRFEGPLPHVLKNMVSVQSLSLHDNNFNGSIPLWLRAMRRLQVVDLSANGFNYVEGGIMGIMGNPCSFKYLDLSDNNITQGDILEPSMSLSGCGAFDLEYLDLSNNMMNGSLSSSFGNFTNLNYFYLHGTSMNGILPSSLGKLTNLIELDLSYNEFQGQVPAYFLNLTALKFLGLSNTGILGELPQRLWNSSSLLELDLSGNRLTGSLPQNITRDGPYYNFYCLDLHNNFLTGTLPNWLGHMNAEFIDVSSNRLSGPIYDGNNASSLFNIGQSLYILDLSDNMLSGEIKFGKVPFDATLEVLSLRGNHFNGAISAQLCNFVLLMVLELAHNRLTGHIPRCLGSMQFINGAGVSGESLQIEEIFKGVVEFSTGTKGGQLIIDLSSNYLVGTIPKELTNISALFALNLSYNHLTGHIPENIGNLKAIESLDLSNNHLSGTIPQSLSSISWLSYLNLSNNNLHGPIPTGTQLQTLDDPSTYAGNSGLCGFPLPKNCTDFHSAPSLTNVDPTAGEKENKYDKMCFILAVMSGVATGFWGVVGTLVIKKSRRESYFRYVEDLADRIYVPIKVRVNKFKRRFNENSQV